MSTQARHRKPSSLPAARSRPSAPAAPARHRRPQGTVSSAQPAAAPWSVARDAPVHPPAAAPRSAVPPAGAARSLTRGVPARRPAAAPRSAAQPATAPRSAAAAQPAAQPATAPRPAVPPATAPQPAAQPATAPRPASRRAAATRHRKPSALQGKPAKATAVTALAVSAAAASAAVTQWPGGISGHSAAARVAAMITPGANLAAADAWAPGATGPAGSPADALATISHRGFGLIALEQPQPKGRHHRRPAVHVAAAAPTPSRPSPAPPPGSPPPSSSPYSNPLRAVTGLIPERVDMGVDFAGSGPVYALGDGVITNATGNSSGWPGGGWITYRLTDGPDAGLVVYVAEDVQPAVSVGEAVTPSTVIANMYGGGVGIETGWAMPDGASAESQLPEAGGIGGNGPFPTMVGLSFENLLRSLGVPASPGAGSGYGILPPGYPAA